MQDLASALIKPLILITIDYSLGAGLIVLIVNASLIGWGAVLMQVINRVCRPAYYKSSI